MGAVGLRPQSEVSTLEPPHVWAFTVNRPALSSPYTYTHTHKGDVMIFKVVCFFWNENLVNQKPCHLRSFRSGFGTLNGYLIESFWSEPKTFCLARYLIQHMFELLLQITRFHELRQWSATYFGTKCQFHEFTATLQIVLVKICQHLPNVGSNIDSLNCLVNLTPRWAKVNQTLGNNLPNNSSKKGELGKFYATLVKCCPMI